MITNVQLTDSGAAAFNAFFDANAKPAVRREVVAIEVMDVMLDRLSCGESLTYELGRQYTAHGNPALLTLRREDLEVTEETDAE